jgi:DNA polymerase-1
VGNEEITDPFSFDMALQEPVFYMTQTGMRVDLDRRNEFREQYEADWAMHQVKLDAIVGHELNVNSTKAVPAWLYEELKLPTRRYQNKVTTREPALRSLLAYCEEKVKSAATKTSRDRYLRGYISLMQILKIRGIRKRLSSYINAKVDNDIRMRSSISVGGTETGRFSHSKTLWGTGCNLATVPRELRGMFIASDGYELAEFDLNRGESWVYAHLSEDPELLRIHTEFGDFHAETAVAIASAFGEYIRDWDTFANDNPDKAYKTRYMGKKVNHASAYRMGPFKGAEEVNKEADDTGITCTVTQFKKAQSLWHRKYIRMKSWWDRIEIQLNEDRTLVTPFGRVRTFYAHWGDELFKEATAYVPQSTSVDYLNRGMLEVYRRLVLPGFHGLRLLHQQHDSIVVEYHEGYREEVIQAVIECLTDSIEVNGLIFTIPVEAQFGPRWGKEMSEYAEAS